MSGLRLIEGVTAMDATHPGREGSPERVVDAYRRAQDGFDAVLAAVPDHLWDAPSACAEWTVRDVLVHVIWGQELIRHLAAGQEYAKPIGRPGSAHPGQHLGGDDPLASWCAARDAATIALTPRALDQPAPERFRAAHPGALLRDFVWVLVLDFLAHTWDIGNPLGIDVRLDPELVAASWPTASQIVVRSPGFFDPELTPPAGADEQTRWLAYLGRVV